MNTKQIDYIIELSQTLNFNRAAENLFISQPSLTYQIKMVEDEIGFKIFDRSGKGAALTPAGSQFCITLRNIKEELKKAIEQGQNISTQYSENINISVPIRSAIYFLPQAIKEFSKIYPSVSITPHFIYGESRLSSFLKGQEDILFALKEEAKQIPDVKIYDLFKSHIFLITLKSDPLAKKELITMEDLEGRTLMIGGGSPPSLRKVQQRIINSINIKYFNSNDHETTLINVASEKGICLSPGFLNDHNDEFAWIPFDCTEFFNCALITHANDNRKSLQDFIKLLQSFYQSNNKIKF